MAFLEQQQARPVFGVRFNHHLQQDNTKRNVKYTFGIRAFKNDTATVQSEHHLCTASLRKLHGLPMISIRRLWRLHDDSTEFAHFRKSTRSILLLCRFLLSSAPRSNCMMLVHSMNTYSIARSHHRYLKDHTENRRPICCTALGANVN